MIIFKKIKRVHFYVSNRFTCMFHPYAHNYNRFNTFLYWNLIFFFSKLVSMDKYCETEEISQMDKDELVIEIIVINVSLELFMVTCLVV
jgi:hypothetical protein